MLMTRHDGGVVAYPAGRGRLAPKAAAGEGQQWAGRNDVGITAGVPRLIADLLQRPSRPGRARKRIIEDVLEA
jgi:hypothetical protein